MSTPNSTGRPSDKSTVRGSSKDNPQPKTTPPLYTQGQAGIPEFYNTTGPAMGTLKTLTKKSFPKGKIGKIAFNDYQMEKLKAKRAELLNTSNDRGKLEKRKSDLQKKLDAVNERLKELEQTEPTTK